VGSLFSYAIATLLTALLVATGFGVLPASSTTTPVPGAEAPPGSVGEVPSDAVVPTLNPPADLVGTEGVDAASGLGSTAGADLGEG